MSAASSQSDAIPSPNRHEQFAGRLARNLDQDLSNVRLDVVIMGPALPFDRMASASADADEDDLESVLLSTRPGSRLREYIFRRCRLMNMDVTAEHPSFEGMTGSAGIRSLTHLEHRIVKESDLLIIVPDSVGSFCELGYFAMQSNFYRKMLILCDSDSLDGDSYLVRGPLTAARDHAQVEEVPYRSLDGAWELVAQRIDDERFRRLMREDL